MLIKREREMIAKTILRAKMGTILFFSNWFEFEGRFAVESEPIFLLMKWFRSVK